MCLAHVASARRCPERRRDAIDASASSLTVQVTDSKKLAEIFEDLLNHYIPDRQNTCYVIVMQHPEFNVLSSFDLINEMKKSCSWPTSRYFRLYRRIVFHCEAVIQKNVFVKKLELQGRRKESPVNWRIADVESNRRKKC